MEKLMQQRHFHDYFLTFTTEPIVFGCEYWHYLIICHINHLYTFRLSTVSHFYQGKLFLFLISCIYFFILKENIEEHCSSLHNCPFEMSLRLTE